MKKCILLSLIFLFQISSTHASVINTCDVGPSYAESIEDKISSIDLPVIHVNTINGEEPTCKSINHPENCIGTAITDNSYVKGEITIHKNKNLIFNSGKYKKNTSGMRIKVRGNSSATLPYKSFKVKLEVKEDLLRRTDEKFKDKNWLLLNIMSTRDLRTVVSFYVAKLMRNEWEPEYQFVNLFVNGDYRGLYMLCENVKDSDGRCKISDPTGFLIEADPYWWNEDIDKPVIKTNYLPYAMGYTFKYPDLLKNDPKINEIKDYLNAFEDALYNEGDLYRYIDIKSFASWILTHDLLGTADGAGSNYYLIKDDLLNGESRYNSKLRMGPLWDFDTVFEKPGEWATSHDVHLFYYKDLFKRFDFIKEYYSQWMQIHNNITPNVMAFISDFIAKYGRAIDESRKSAPVYKQEWITTVDENKLEIKEWLEQRIPWMDKAVSDLMDAASISEVNKESEITCVTIYDTKGTVCKTLKGNEAYNVFYNGRDINLSLNSGIYIISARYNDGSVKTKKYIKL